MSAQAATAVKTGTFSTGLMDIQSMDSGGFTAIMDDAELARRLKPVTTVGRTRVVAAAVRQRRPELELLVRARRSDLAYPSWDARLR